MIYFQLIYLVKEHNSLSVHLILKKEMGNKNATLRTLTTYDLARQSENFSHGPVMRKIRSQ